MPRKRCEAADLTLSEEIYLQEEFSPYFENLFQRMFVCHGHFADAFALAT